MNDYRLEEAPFLSKRDTGVSLFRAFSLSRNRQVVIKSHKFSDIRLPETLLRINQTLNAALAQAKVHHPNTCEILEVQFVFNDTGCTIHHVLEALDTDAFEDMKKRRASHKPYSETELTSLLRQTSTALDFAHSKVRFTLGNRPSRPKAR